MNLGEIRTKSIETLREQASPVGVTEAELNRYINDGYREIAEATKMLVEEVTLNVLGGEHFVALPANSLAPLTFVDDASGYPIRPVHWTWVDKRDARWIRVSRSRPSLVSAFGLKEVFFYPAYDADATVTMNHCVVPATGFPTLPLVNDTDIPDFPEQHHMALVFYANYRAMLKDADGPKLGRALRQKGYYVNTVQGVEVWSVDRHETLHTAVYGTPKDAPKPYSEFG